MDNLMDKEVKRTGPRLTAGSITNLPHEEIAVILRGAHELVMKGGRSMLVKILKGIETRKILEVGLDRSPVYGYYVDLALEEIQARVDWTIVNGYLGIGYDHRRPLLKYRPQGWEIERETYANELLQGFEDMLAESEGPFDLDNLKEQNRDIIFLLLDKIKATGDKKYLPLLEQWAKVEYKRVSRKINKVIKALNRNQIDGTG